MQRAASLGSPQYEEEIVRWGELLLSKISENIWLINSTPQAPDKFNPKVNLQTCGIIQEGNLLKITKKQGLEST